MVTSGALNLSFGRPHGLLSSRRRIFVEFISPFANTRCPYLSGVGERFASSSASVRSLQTHPIFLAQVRWARCRGACAHLDVCLECRGHDGSRSVQRVQARSAACARLLLFNSLAALFLRFCEVWEVWCAIVLGVRVPLCLGVSLARLRSPLSRGLLSVCTERCSLEQCLALGFFEVIFCVSLCGSVQHFSFHCGWGLKRCFPCVLYWKSGSFPRQRVSFGSSGAGVSCGVGESVLWQLKGGRW